MQTMNSAIGIVEMFGFVTAITAADAAAKAADVKIIAIDSDKSSNVRSAEAPLTMAVKMQGDVSAVKKAVDAAVKAADSISGSICAKVISGSADDALRAAQAVGAGL